MAWLLDAEPTGPGRLEVPKGSRFPESVHGTGGYADIFKKFGLYLRPLDTRGGHWHYWYVAAKDLGKLERIKQCLRPAIRMARWLLQPGHEHLLRLGVASQVGMILPQLPPEQASLERGGAAAQGAGMGGEILGDHSPMDFDRPRLPALPPGTGPQPGPAPDGQPGVAAIRARMAYHLLEYYRNLALLQAEGSAGGAGATPGLLPFPPMPAIPELATPGMFQTGPH
jgi:hypothetical protein